MPKRLNQPLIVTTETRTGRVCSLLDSASLAVIAGALAHMALRPMPIGPSLLFAILLTLGAGLLLLPPALATIERRGSWRLDADGIRFEPRTGRSVALRWDEVRRLRCARGVITMCGADATMRVGSARLGASAWVALREATCTALRHRFAIEEVDRPGSPRLRRSATLAALAVATALAAAARASTGVWWPGLLVLTTVALRAAGAIVASRRRPWLLPAARPPADRLGAGRTRAA